LCEWAGGGCADKPSKVLDSAVRGDEYGECAGGGGVSIVMIEGDELSRDRAAYSCGSGSHESASESIVELLLYRGPESMLESYSDGHEHLLASSASSSSSSSSLTVKSIVSANSGVCAAAAAAPD